MSTTSPSSSPPSSSPPSSSLQKPSLHSSSSLLGQGKFPVFTPEGCSFSPPKVKPTLGQLKLHIPALDRIRREERQKTDPWMD